MLGALILTLLIATARGCNIVVRNSTCNSSLCILNPQDEAVAVDVSNHSTYTISNCNNTTVSFAPSSTMSLIENVTIAVVGPEPSLLPSIQLGCPTCPSPPQWHNLNIVLRNVTVSHSATTPSSAVLMGSKSCSQLVSNVSILFDGAVVGMSQEVLSVSCGDISNVSMIMVNSHLTITNVPLIDISGTISISNLLLSVSSSTVQWDVDGSAVLQAPHYALVRLRPTGTEIVSNVEVIAVDAMILASVNTSSITHLGGTQLYSFSVMYITFTSSVGRIASLTFVASGSAILMSHIQNQSISAVVQASMNGLLLFLDFANSGQTSNSIDGLIVNITRSIVHITASTAAQLVLLTGVSQSVSFLDRASIIVANVSVAVFVVGVLPLAVSSRRGSILALINCNISNSFLQLNEATLNSTLELGDGGRNHTGNSGSKGLIPWVFQSELLYLSQSTFEQSVASVCDSHMSFATASERSVITIDATSFLSVAVATVELVGFSFVMIVGSTLQVEGSSMNASLIMTLTGQYIGLTHFAQLTIVTVFGSSKKSNVSVRDVDLHVSKFRLSSEAPSVFSSVISVVQCYVATAVATVFSETNFINAPWSNSRIDVINNTTIVAAAGDVVARTPSILTMISVPQNMVQNTIILLNISSFNTVQLQQRCSEGNMLLLPIVPILSGNDNVTTVSLNSKIIITGDMGCAPFLVASSSSSSFQLSRGGEILVVNVLISIVNASTYTTAFATLTPSLSSELYLFGCKISILDSTSVISFATSVVTVAPRTNISLAAAPPLFIAYEPWVNVFAGNPAFNVSVCGTTVVPPATESVTSVDNYNYIVGNWWCGAPMQCADLGLQNSLSPLVRFTHLSSAAISGEQCHIFVCPSTHTVTAESEGAIDVANTPASNIAQTSSAIGGVGAAASFLGAAVGSLAAFDAQALAGLGLSSCVPELAASTSPARFVVSPFYDLGPFGIVFGNVGLTLLIGCSHCALVRLYEARSMVTTPQRHREQHPLAGPLTVTSSSYGSRRPSHVALRFPHHSMTASMLLLPGVGFACAALLFRGDAGGVVGGVVAAGVLGGAVWVRLRVIGQHLNVIKLKFSVFTRSEVVKAKPSLGPYLRKLPSWVVPSGRWLPLRYAATHGRARSAVIGGQEWLSEYAVVYTVAMNFVSGLPLSATECGVVFGVACIIPLTGLVAMIWRRPCRVPLLTWLNVLQYLLSFAVMLSTAILRSDAQAIDRESLAASVLLSSLALALSSVTLLKLAGTVAAQLWEARVLLHFQETERQLLAASAVKRQGKTTSTTLLESTPPMDKEFFGSRQMSARRLFQSSSNQFSEALPLNHVDLLSLDQRNALRLLVDMCCECKRDGEKQFL
ncbi:membrane-associated protein, putative [Bodo saltans]|uniref:Membrane-associated protein, putative n=1 Tax=Bodo saltans TaxID=75058 RepID=A0A0S4J758_BODSA|nr:membrane-associated protein, putative [Bodo saltans]|eukprot:CUG85795.1 membrane-associated protein, putative [Bodo saltans]